jgi:peptide/nickel transport system permease protein
LNRRASYVSFGVIRFAVRRLFSALFALWIVSIAIFVIVEILPGDIARLMLGPFASAHDIGLIHIQLGLDRPLVLRYEEWLHGFLTGDWGESWRLRTPIAPLVMTRLANSALLAAFAVVTIVPLSILGGVVAALRRGRLADRLISIGGMCLMAVPEFVSSMFLIFIFSLWLKLLPSSTRLAEGQPISSQLQNLILPAVALALVLFGYISRMVRASMVEELSRGYVRTARLKGLAPQVVIIRHVLRNALLPTVTVIANQISWLVGGLVVVENVFNYPGLGQLLLQAALSQDVPMLEITVLILATILIAANLAADILYGLLNPRIRIQPHGAAA